MHARNSAGPRARAALREATSEVHERLHVSPAFLAISQGRLGLSGYAELLSTLAGLYFALAEELGIEGVRLDALRRDLADLAAPDPEPVTWAAPKGQAERLGWRYVVEGSIFGGQVIHRQLDYLLGEAEGGRRFFAGAPGAAERWRALCNEFEQVGAQDGNLAKMVAGSHSAFALFERHLGSERVHD